MVPPLIALLQPLFLFHIALMIKRAVATELSAVCLYHITCKHISILVSQGADTARQERREHTFSTRGQQIRPEREEKGAVSRVPGARPAMGGPLRGDLRQDQR